MICDLAYFVVAIVFVSGVESLLCSRMADRLADNRGMPFNPNKELWGQGWVQIVVPLFNGFPHTGALARTATNIKVGAVSPLAGIFKFVLKLLLAVFLAQYLEMVPMACIGGILLFVAVEHGQAGRGPRGVAPQPVPRRLMIYTAVMVPATDFLIGVLSALVIYGVTYRWFDMPAEAEPALEPDLVRSGAPRTGRKWLTIVMPKGVLHDSIHSTADLIVAHRAGRGRAALRGDAGAIVSVAEVQFLHVVPPGPAAEVRPGAVGGEAASGSVAVVRRPVRSLAI